ncbi:hypothetical protein K438DRAFT_1927018 [Mycena galopus ATCC 62051]|nr:hypothetical protein K438DRAFT_1927018 [Mycena galopus ATCC 62051]
MEGSQYEQTLCRKDKVKGRSHINCEVKTGFVHIERDIEAFPGVRISESSRRLRVPRRVSKKARDSKLARDITKFQEVQAQGTPRNRRVDKKDRVGGRWRVAATGSRRRDCQYLPGKMQEVARYGKERSRIAKTHPMVGRACLECSRRMRAIWGITNRWPRSSLDALNETPRSRAGSSIGNIIEWPFKGERLDHGRKQDGEKMAKLTEAHAEVQKNQVSASGAEDGFILVSRRPQVIADVEWKECNGRHSLTVCGVVGADWEGRTIRRSVIAEVTSFVCSQPESSFGRKGHQGKLAHFATKNKSNRMMGRSTANNAWFREGTGGHSCAGTLAPLSDSPRFGNGEAVVAEDLVGLCLGSLCFHDVDFINSEIFAVNDSLWGTDGTGFEVWAQPPPVNFWGTIPDRIPA